MRVFPPCDGVEHRFVDAAGLRMHVACAGPEDGNVVLLLHGWPEHWWLWHRVIPVLADAGFRVLAPDLRGFGWTDAPPRGYHKEQLATDVLALLDALGVGEVLLAGHDWGGWTGQLVALRAPARVRRLALLNIPPIWQPTGQSLRRAHRLAYQLPLAAPGLGPRAQRMGLTWWLLRRAGLPPAQAAEFRAAWADTAHARAGSQIYRSFLLKDMPAVARGRYDAQRLAMPVRVLFGVDDVVVHRRMFDSLAERADDSAITEVPDCGHFVVDEQPELTARWLLEWARG